MYGFFYGERKARFVTPPELQLIDMRYETKSTIFTTNITFEQWDKIFFDAVVANAILDRILHHAHIITITGKSYRLKDCLFNKE